MILVTGGTGLVGSHLINELTAKDLRVRAIRRSSSSLVFFHSLFPHLQANSLLEWVEADVLDVFSIEEALEGVTEVYHCAGAVSFKPADAKWVIKTNVEGTANVVNAALAKGVQKFCLVSSVAALGRTEGKLIDETDDWKKELSGSIYSLSKFGAEREAWRASAEGLNVVIVNPTIILGPSCWKNGSATLFRTVDKGLKYYTEGVNGFVDVRDVVNTMISLMQANAFNERYVINAENITYKSLFDLIANELSKKAPYIKVSSTLSEIIWRLEKIRTLFTARAPFVTKESARTANRSSEFSSEKVKRKTGISFMPIEKSITDTCKVYRQTAHLTC